MNLQSFDLLITAFINRVNKGLFAVLRCIYKYIYICMLVLMLVNRLELGELSNSKYLF